MSDKKDAYFVETTYVFPDESSAREFVEVAQEMARDHKPPQCVMAMIRMGMAELDLEFLSGGDAPLN